MTLQERAYNSIDSIRQKSDACLLFCSLGKDSLVLLDMLYPKFERIVCVFMYFVKDLEHINALSEDFRASIIRNLPYINEPFVIEDNEKLTVDRNMAKFEIVGYRVVNGVYSSQVTVEDEMKKNGISIEESDSDTASTVHRSR